MHQTVIEPLAAWKNWIDGAAAICTFIAAAYWFNAPVMKLLDSDIAIILIASGKESRPNARAAGFAGSSAILVGLSVVIGTRWG